MYKAIYHSISILFLVILPAYAIPVTGQKISATLVDEEYDRYKKRADIAFKEGDYHTALRQYYNCLAVPGFESDEYTQQKINDVRTCQDLSTQATTALRDGKGAEAINLFNQLLAINPDDSRTRNQITTFYESTGDGFFDDKKYVNAKKNYKQAISYSLGHKKADLARKLNNVNRVRTTSQRIKLQMTTGVIAAGSTIYALLLRSDYIIKRNTLNQISSLANESPIPGTIDDIDLYNRYKESYAAAQVAESKRGLYVASLSVAVAAALAEVYLIQHKPKGIKTLLTWRPSSDSVGLALGYAF